MPGPARPYVLAEPRRLDDDMHYILRDGGATVFIHDADLTPNDVRCLLSRRLETLSFQLYEDEADTALRDVAACCPNLKSLDAGDVGAARAATLALVGDACPRLESVSLCASCLDAAAVGAVARASLTELNLYNCADLEDNALWHVGAAAPNLISQCIKITDLGIVPVAVGCRKLECLYAYSIPKPSDASLEALGTHCRDLAQVFIDGWTEITGDGLALLFAGCRKLVNLCVAQCANLTWLPANIGTLSELRGLSIAGTSLRSLPPSTCDLHDDVHIYSSDLETPPQHVMDGTVHAVRAYFNA